MNKKFTLSKSVFYPSSRLGNFSKNLFEGGGVGGLLIQDQGYFKHPKTPVWVGVCFENRIFKKQELNILQNFYNFLVSVQSNLNSLPEVVEVSG